MGSKKTADRTKCGGNTPEGVTEQKTKRGRPPGNRLSYAEVRHNDAINQRAQRQATSALRIMYYATYMAMYTQFKLEMGWKPRNVKRKKMKRAMRTNTNDGVIGAVAAFKPYVLVKHMQEGGAL